MIGQTREGTRLPPGPDSCVLPACARGVYVAAAGASTPPAPPRRRSQHSLRAAVATQRPRRRDTPSPHWVCPSHGPRHAPRCARRRHRGAFAWRSDAWDGIVATQKQMRPHCGNCKPRRPRHRGVFNPAGRAGRITSVADAESGAGGPCGERGGALFVFVDPRAAGGPRRRPPPAPCSGRLGRIRGSLKEPVGAVGSGGRRLLRSLAWRRHALR